ncbi:hypothetical protein PENSUB_9529 [Penicillium subrubescens]|uniref:Uncharacterized protein n=1 Tax=Penicillium subrubescens TaxID=1316194 RepID=A0A1Q5TCZ2_9EURO|nr:hypothetical protein PENSUB_9529 [Penicillium subrubescens]
MRVVKLLAILGVALCKAAAEGCGLSSYCIKHDTHDHVRNGQSQSGIVHPASKRAGGVSTTADLKSQGSSPSRIPSMILPRSAAVPTISSFEWTASTVYTTRVITPDHKSQPVQKPFSATFDFDESVYSIREPQSKHLFSVVRLDGLYDQILYCDKLRSYCYRLSSGVYSGYNIYLFELSYFYHY